MKLWQQLASQYWAMTEESLRALLASAEKMPRGAKALAKQRDDFLPDGDRARIRNGVAIINVRGPLVRYDAWWLSWIGCTSFESLARDFNAALEDPSVTDILLNIDSPGGEVNGTHEFAEMVYSARDKKRIWSYIGGFGCSAAYWIASAASKIVIDATAMAPSVGVIGVYYDYTKMMADLGIKEIVIVSDQSPLKDTDPADKAGYDRIRGTITDLGAVFVSRVARNRGIKEDVVLAQYGKGWVVVGQAAVDEGVVDALGSFEGVIAEMTTRTPALFGALSAKERTMDPKDNPAGAGATAEQTVVVINAESLQKSHPELVAQFRAEGAENERNRIAGIDALLIPGHEKIAATAKADGSITPEAFAVLQVHAEKKASSAGLKVIQDDENSIEVKPEAAAAPAGAEATQNAAREPLARDEKKVSAIVGAISPKKKTEQK